jgi:ActR/RegA family two-component response regulator
MVSHEDKRSQLAGISVLTVDDDYYQATDAARTFAKVGATVIGPCGQVDQALALIESTAIDCAVVDLNLGAGASFDVPRFLKSRGIPLLVVTGYDETMLPPDLKGTPWLEKPVQPSEMTRALAQVLRDARAAG